MWLSKAWAGMWVITRTLVRKEGSNMCVTVISSTDLRVKTRDIMEDAKFNNKHFIVETFGKPMAAIIGIDEYNELMRLKEQHPCLHEETDWSQI
jgi:hypothetical protein